MRIHSRASALSSGQYVGQTHRLSRALKKMSAGGHWYMSPYISHHISHHISPVYRPYRTSHVDTFPRAYPAHIPLTSCSHPAHVSPVSRPHITPIPGEAWAGGCWWLASQYPHGRVCPLSRMCSQAPPSPLPSPFNLPRPLPLFYRTICVLTLTISTALTFDRTPTLTEPTLTFGYR